VTGEAGEHPFARLVGERGGVALDAGAGALEAPLDGAAFVAILARGDDILPPVARLDRLLAGAWLVLAAGPAAGPREAAAASALAARVGSEGPPAYLVSAGRVGGSSADPRSRSIEPELVARVLDAAAAGAVEWETDPDFGYELPMDLPGLEVAERRVLVPRFLYARTDRVYDYAAMVPARQRERAARLAALPGLDAAIARAPGVGLPERRPPAPPARRR
jgi:phosphoenolpyruvate carboxykinase (ATP)